MAGLKFASIVVLTAALLLALAVTGARSQCPPENPFCPVWVPCNFTETKGPYCQDCHTRVICTPVGGLVRPCWFPTNANCVDGQCVANPGPGCEPEPPSSPEPTTGLPPTVPETDSV